MTRTRSRIVVLGAGDLGLRIGKKLEAELPDAHVVVLGRAQLEIANTRAVERALRETHPDVIVQAACLLSPWELPSRTDPIAQALSAAGFAVQVSAQLPLLLSVMRAQREVDPTIPVVNCSYPDVTHPMLSALGLAPTIGIGNVAMIHRSVAESLQHRGEGQVLVRVVAHHAHVTQVMRADAALGKGSRPLVLLGEAATPDDTIAYAGAPQESNRELNALSAATALPIIAALLPGAEPLRTSAPGPLGLGGGYPVWVSRSGITLDLPSGLSRDAAFSLTDAAAREDGVGGIDADGTLHYTDEARGVIEARAPQWRGLLDSLRPEDSLGRFELLRRALQI